MDSPHGQPAPTVAVFAYECRAEVQTAWSTDMPWAVPEHIQSHFDKNNNSKNSDVVNCLSRHEGLPNAIGPNILVISISHHSGVFIQVR